MKVTDGRETLDGSAYLLDRGYGEIVFNGIIFLHGSTENMLKIHSMLRDEFNVISIKGCDDKENWDIALHEEIPSWIKFNNKGDIKYKLNLKERVVKFLEQIDIDNMDAFVANDIKFFDYKRVCDDAKKYFEKIVGKETTLKGKKGKFVTCEHCEGRFLENYEHEYIFKLVEEIKGNNCIVIMDNLMLSHGIKNGYI